MHIPVPWVFTIAYLVGYGAQFLVPVSIGESVWLTFTEVLGISLLVVGAVLAFWAQWIFHKVHTTTVPYGTSTKLVDWGPYRFSRNPMYLGLFLFFAGVSVALTFVWSLLILLGVMYYLNSAVVPLEERQLARSFKEAYQSYFREVRRWL